MIKYPSAFPRPTAKFEEAVTAFSQRTPMESGHTRGRRRWQDPYTTYSLTFEMDTNTFHKWDAWVQTNGYDWFTMELDIVQGARQTKDIRFITPRQTKYINYNHVYISVRAESSNVKANPDPIAPWPVDENGNPIPPPEPPVDEYTCDSFTTYMLSINALIWQPTNLAYPQGTVPNGTTFDIVGGGNPTIFANGTGIQQNWVDLADDFMDNCTDVYACYITSGALNFTDDQNLGINRTCSLGVVFDLGSMGSGEAAQTGTVQWEEVNSNGDTFFNNNEYEFKASIARRTGTGSTVTLDCSVKCGGVTTNFFNVYSATYLEPERQKGPMLFTIVAEISSLMGGTSTCKAYLNNELIGDTAESNVPDSTDYDITDSPTAVYPGQAQFVSFQNPFLTPQAVSSGTIIEMHQAVQRNRASYEPEA